MKKALGILMLLALAPAGTTRAAELVTDLSEHLIAITSSFQGAELLLFGSIQETPGDSAPTAGSGDIVVVVRGPNQPLVVRRKKRVAGIWVNAKAVEFDSVPGYYAVLSNRPLAEIAPPAVLARHRIGLPYLDIISRVDGIDDEAGEFRAAILRAKSRENLYIQDEDAVSFLGGALFRTDLTFPANVPVGNYTTQVYLLRGGRMISAQTSPLFVDKSGLERRIYQMAHGNPATYGLMAVIIAILAGWLAAVVFRRG